MTNVIIISIHAPHTGRDLVQAILIDGEIISIHAPHTGRDHTVAAFRNGEEVFQSTRPIRGATVISFTQQTFLLYFNPRAPYGARP